MTNYGSNLSHKILILAAVTVFVLWGNCSTAKETCELRALGAVSGRPKSGLTLHFYRNGQPTTVYRDLLDLLRENPEGTKLNFGKGGILTVKNFVAEGGTSFFIDTPDGRFIKVFLTRLIQASRDPGDQQFIVFVGPEDFVDNQRELKEAGVPVVDINLGGSRMPYYVEVEKLPIEFTLDGWAEAKKSMSKKEAKLVEDRLVDWARSTWRFSYIGDFNPSQLGYTGEGWVLFDFGQRNYLADERKAKNTFSPVNYDGDIVNMVDHGLYDRIKKAIKKKRKDQFD